LATRRTDPLSLHAALPISRTCPPPGRERALGGRAPSAARPRRARARARRAPPVAGARELRSRRRPCARASAAQPDRQRLELVDELGRAHVWTPGTSSPPMP